MSEPITFFHKRHPDAGHTYAFDLEASTRGQGTATRLYRIFIYSREPVEKSVVQSRKLQDNVLQETKRIRQAITTEGAIVWTYEEARVRFFQVEPVGEGDSIFRSYGVLRPGSELSLEEVKLEKWLQVPVGTHLMVPVNREAEGHLREMKGFLGWLPPDLESLILYAIRKPSLDARIRDLEAKGRGRLNRIREWSVPILLALILVLNAALLYRSLRQDRSSADDKKKDVKSEATKETTPAPEEVVEQAQRIFKVLQAVQGKVESVPAFASLRNGNFKGLTRERDVAAALKDAKRAQPLVLGLVKLEALRLDSTAASGLFGEANNLTTVKEFFLDRNPESDSGDMLAALACAAYQTPGLPVTREGRSAALSFVQNQDCTSFPLDKATQGLGDLLDFVQHYSPADDAAGGAS